MGTEAGTGNDDRKGRRTMALSLISLHGPSLSLPFISWSLLHGFATLGQSVSPSVTNGRSANPCKGGRSDRDGGWFQFSGPSVVMVFIFLSGGLEPENHHEPHSLVNLWSFITHSIIDQ